jgi:PAS domain S-box-containing protein
MPKLAPDPHVTEERLRRALRSGQIVTWEWDLETGHLTWSDNALNVLGWTSDRATDFDERVHPEDQKRHQAALQKTFSEGVPYDVEIRFVRPDGTIIWIGDKAELHTDTTGHRILSGTTIDITSRKRAEEEAEANAQALRKSEERFRLAMRATRDVIWDWDIRDNRVVRSEALEPVFGYALQNVQSSGSWWVNLIHPDDRQSIASSIQVATQSRDEHWTAEYRVRRADGTYAYVLDRAYLIRDAEGVAIRMVGATLDQTQQRAADAALRESERQYRLLAENTGDMIILTGPDRVRRYVSPASREIVGYKPEELLNISGPDQTHPDDVAWVTAQFDDMFTHRLPVTVASYRLRHKEGHWVPVEARRRLILDESGTPEAVLSAIRDISERVKLEEQLRQSQKMEAVGQLTGGIAHDFNNLLTVIVGNAELLVDDPSDPDQTRSLAGMVLQAAEKGADLTQRLLAFGRRQTLTPERLNLDQVVENMGSLLRRTIPASIEIATELQKADLAALTDRTLLESAILNVVVNARDAMPEGGTLTIRTGERVATVRDGSVPAGQPVVFVSICDTGTGMSPEVLARVFEPFYTTKAVGKGSGLGLAMVHGFVEQAGGHVSIESAIGQGTTVTILLPAIDKFSIQAPVESEVAGTTMGGGRVLVVEDEPQVLHFVCSQLVSFGYRIEAVSAGPDALDVLRQDQSFDLLFTDVVMPKGMSGIELARRAREIKPDLRVLLTSGYPEEVFQEHGTPDADTPLLRKPYRRKELAVALRKVLE